MDIEGYGPRPEQSDIDRLLEDCRTLSPAGVERAASGWETRRDPEGFRSAETEALRVLERANLTPRWDELRNQLLGLTERGQPLVAWQREHGDVGHRAEDALLAAALALVAAEHLDAAQSELLRAPLAEALPWLGRGRPAELE